MLAYITVFVFQVIYIVIKFVSIRQVVGNVLSTRLIATSLASVVWLLTTSLGVEEMIAGNYWILIPYVLGALVGVVLEHFVRRRI